MLNSDLEIKQLAQGQTILDFALENAGNRVMGFIVNPHYPSDAPDESEYFVVINRDQSGNRLLVTLLPYTGGYKCIYERPIFNNQWNHTKWRKKSYIQLQYGVANPNTEGEIQVTFENEFDATPYVILQNYGERKDIAPLSNVYGVTNSGFKAVCLLIQDNTIIIDAYAEVYWIALALS